ncbi:MAG TPA: hypothetical protein VGB14_20480 [Acidimicrobiales bacterium]|jgi:hypothetical protein
MASPTTTTTPTGRRPRRPWTAGRVAAAVVIAALVAMWAYAFSGAASHESPLRVADRRWADGAAEACAPMVAAIDALPPANTARTPQERAEVLRRANAEVAATIDRLAAVPPPADAEDARMVERWLADWRTYLGDRDAYADLLAAGRDERFTLTAVNGDAITEQMDDFALYNDLPDCETPGDV